MSFDSGQVLAYAPMLVLIAMGCVMLLAETFVRGTGRSGLAWLGVAGCIAALITVVVQWPDAATAQTHFDGMLVVDRMALYLDAAFIVAALLTLAVRAALPARARSSSSASSTPWCCSRPPAW